MEGRCAPRPLCGKSSPLMGGTSGLERGIGKRYRKKREGSGIRRLCRQKRTRLEYRGVAKRGDQIQGKVLRTWVRTKENSLGEERGGGISGRKKWTDPKRKHTPEVRAIKCPPNYKGEETAKPEEKKEVREF